MIRNSLRAMVVLAAGLLVAATWPAFAIVAGVALAGGAAWRFRSRLRLGTPYLVAGVLLGLAGLTLALVAPSHDTTTISHNPIRYCRPGQVTC